MTVIDGTTLAGYAEAIVGTPLAASLAQLNEWDAVIEVARIRGAITAENAADLRRIDRSLSSSRFFARDDKRIKHAEELPQAGPGAFLAFISVDQDA